MSIPSIPSTSPLTSSLIVPSSSSTPLYNRQPPTSTAIGTVAPHVIPSAVNTINSTTTSSSSSSTSTRSVARVTAHQISASEFQSFIDGITYDLNKGLRQQCIEYFYAHLKIRKMEEIPQFQEYSQRVEEWSKAADSFGGVPGSMDPQIGKLSSILNEIYNKLCRELKSRILSRQFEMSNYHELTDKMDDITFCDAIEVNFWCSNVIRNFVSSNFKDGVHLYDVLYKLFDFIQPPFRGKVFNKLLDAYEQVYKGIATARVERNGLLTANLLPIESTHITDAENGDASAQMQVGTCYLLWGQLHEAKHWYAQALQNYSHGEQASYHEEAQELIRVADRLLAGRLLVSATSTSSSSSTSSTVDSSTTASVPSDDQSSTSYSNSTTDYSPIPQPVTFEPGEVKKANTTAIINLDTVRSTIDLYIKGIDKSGEDLLILFQRLYTLPEQSWGAVFTYALDAYEQINGKLPAIQGRDVKYLSDRLIDLNNQAMGKDNDRAGRALGELKLGTNYLLQGSFDDAKYWYKKAKETENFHQEAEMLKTVADRLLTARNTNSSSSITSSSSTTSPVTPVLPYDQQHETKQLKYDANSSSTTSSLEATSSLADQVYTLAFDIFPEGLPKKQEPQGRFVKALMEEFPTIEFSDVSIDPSIQRELNEGIRNYVMQTIRDTFVSEQDVFEERPTANAIENHLKRPYGTRVREAYETACSMVQKKYRLTLTDAFTEARNASSSTSSTSSSTSTSSTSSSSDTVQSSGPSRIERVATGVGKAVWSALKMAGGLASSLNPMQFGVSRSAPDQEVPQYRGKNDSLATNRLLPENPNDHRQSSQSSGSNVKGLCPEPNKKSDDPQ